MRFRSLLTGRTLLVALVALALVLDICALPAAAEGDAIEVAVSQAPGDTHESNGPHVASCCDVKAVKGAPSCPHARDLLIALPTDVGVLTGAELRTDQRLSTLLAPRRAPDRPLFLLNAVFLI